MKHDTNETSLPATDAITSRRGFLQHAGLASTAAAAAAAFGTASAAPAGTAPAK